MDTIKEVWDIWRELLQTMFTPPWKPTYNDLGNKVDKAGQLFEWFLGWLVSLAGFAALGIFAPYWVQSFNIPSQYQVGAIIAVSFIGGFIWQFVTMLIFGVGLVAVPDANDPEGTAPIWLSGLLNVIWWIFLFGPMVATGIIIWWYFAHFAPNHNLVGSGVLGATILKIFLTIVLPALKGLIFTPLLWLFKRIVWGPEKKEPEKIPTSTKVEESRP